MALFKTIRTTIELAALQTVIHMTWVYSQKRKDAPVDLAEYENDVLLTLNSRLENTLLPKINYADRDLAVKFGQQMALNSCKTLGSVLRVSL